MIFIKDKKYYINVKGFKKFNRRDILTGLFEIKFVYTSKGLYIVMSLTKNGIVFIPEYMRLHYMNL